ncbi:hypothetical protein ATANTOWER_028809 [Ataeniobius toweri]|uniref:Uncharacterized protein n=1 Tax=Ataeniobius toweri TaxID=208326 RepID=A0ABU7ATE8_9TELE|nr:hypothetical protein [Ataeniobius toweri]
MDLLRHEQEAFPADSETWRPTLPGPSPETGKEATSIEFHTSGSEPVGKFSVKTQKEETGSRVKKRSSALLHQRLTLPAHHFSDNTMRTSV